MKISAEALIEKLNLVPLPEEGGYYCESYRAKGFIPAEALPEHGGRRCYGTCIYYLLTPDEFSGLHTVTSDEVFHFYAGDLCEMIQIAQDGTLTEHRLGIDFAAGQRPQVVVQAGVWQGSRLAEGGQWALLGCTVSPGFEFSDFTTASRQELTQRFPQHAARIEQFTH
ncbi:MAG: cupin domain-containing protein [Myxococcales bacterium]|nr:MAG: cupin domain-containing protein [Myxococcales bacterium]